mmetsp:Transcript_38693/g.28573  ORF Transcript_38693/g.28573 Transcript_38693/m.28573 type:complete len:90 (+) Transcript_38693:760-1029(+)
MEEAEALCTKMAIMLGGKLKCFGSSQNIKEKYGTGYELEFKIRTLKEFEVEEIKDNHGFTDVRISLGDAKQLLTKMEASELIEEIRENG